MKRKLDSKKGRGARLGQHLLTNPGIARAVAEAAGIQKGEAVLEIGPGKGMLTGALLALGVRVSAVEKDTGMVKILQERFSKEIKNKQLTVYEGDARSRGPDSIFPTGGYKVAANIPYYITGELLRECLTAKNQPHSLAFLVQKEVAERIARSKKESILSLSVKAYGIPQYVRTVSKGNFSPAPSVDSAILAVSGISRKNFKNISEQRFFEIVKTGFGQKRKMLANNLKKIFGERIFATLAECGIQEKARAEDVPLEKWLQLANKL